MTIDAGADQPHKPDDATDRDYSRAFETFVEGPDDLVGLLAYALYKQTVRETASQGRPALPRSHRHPAPTERAAYRGDAERRLQTFAAIATEEATPDIISRGIGASVASAKAEIAQIVHRRTSIWTAIGVNLAAWVITLAVTVLLLVTIYLPNWQASLIEHIRAVQSEPSTSGPAAAPSSSPR